MITIISATNRKESNTLKVAREYSRLLSEKNMQHHLFSFENIPAGIVNSDIYDEDDHAFNSLQEKYFFASEKLIFILPEYNGSIPGILKTLIDVSDVKKSFHGKKALLVGIATGRAGNLRGMDHLTNILNHLRMTVHWNKLPISKVDLELDESGKFYKPDTLRVIHKQIDEFIAF